MLNDFDALGMFLGLGDLLTGNVRPGTGGTIPSTHSEYITQAIQPVKYSYRPTTFDEYVGQNRGKDKIRLTLKLIEKGFIKHFLLTGNAGHGKTTMAGIIAKHLGYKLYEYVGSSFDILTVQDFLKQNEDNYRPSILFIDEVAEVDKKTLTYMLPIIEDFRHNGKSIKKFILIGATTDKYTVARRCQPFLDRIACHVQMEDYQENDIIKMLQNYNNQIYKIPTETEIYHKVAINTRFCPRIALSTFDLVIGCGDVNRVLEMNGIVKDGLDYRDIKILQHLQSAEGRSVGEETLSIIANTTREEYKELLEPYLLRQGLLSRTSKGRILTTKGFELLRSLNA